MGVAHQRGNEAALCEALIQLLEAKFGSRRADVTHPEKDGSGPPVEVRLRIGRYRVAIEHTVVEPFPQAIQTGVEFGELLGEIETLLSYRLPTPGTYTLVFPIHPTAGRHRRTHERLRQQILAWTVQAGEELHRECPERRGRNDCPGGYHGTRDTIIDGIPLQLSLRVHWSENGSHDGALFVCRSIGDDVETQRLVRMRTALARKLPKLSECAVLGDTTYLILEWSDIALSNHIVIAQALEIALADRNNGPDFVFLADTTTEHWHFFETIIDGEFSIEMEPLQIDRAALTNVSSGDGDG